MLSNESRIWSPGWREQSITALQASPQIWDLIVVGGGITGAGIYREAVKRGLKVLLLEQQDFAWGTSSRSSKMIHGGLRYLGSGDFVLAKDSVRERQQLMEELPGLVDPLPFLMGHYKGKFPGPWIFDKLLAIYDWMAGQRNRHFHRAGIRDYWVPGSNIQQLKGMTQFGDAVTDDARLVMRVLHAANADGGMAFNYLKAVDTLRDDQNKVCGVRVEDQKTLAQFELKAKAVINATGAWTDTLRASLGREKVIRPLRGSHLVVPFWRLPVAFAVSFFHPEDRRPVFVFPWEGVTVIGTTDLDHASGLNNEACISEEEVSYLLAAANHQFTSARLTADDIRSTWAGVRPVVGKNQHSGTDSGKPSDEKREHAIWDDNGLISVAGGKLTTYRLIALDTLKVAAPYLADVLNAQALDSVTRFVFEKTDASGDLADKRLQGRFGQAARQIRSLSNDITQIDYDAHLGTTDTYWRELAWSCQMESIVHLDDLLLRRSRVGLLLDNGGKALFPQFKALCQHYLGWDDATWNEELTRYESIIQRHYSLPQHSSNDAGKLP